MDSKQYIKWMAENSTGNTHHKHFNGVDYTYTTMYDGWIAIFKMTEAGYIPVIQAKDEAHADSYCSMIEAPAVMLNKLVED